MKKIIILLISLFSCLEVLAAPRIDITKGNMEPMPVAINDIGGTDVSTTNIGGEISSVIIADLERSGLFRAIPKEAFIEELNSSKATPQFASWRQINANAFLVGDISYSGLDGIKAEFKLYDSFGEQQIASGTIVGSKRGWRRIAHRIADEIYQSLTGEEGYFNTKVTFISEYGDNPFRKRKRLGVMDYDGENTFYLTDGNSLVLTPRFSPDASKIIYMSYELRVPKVFVFDVAARSHKLIGHFPGMSFAPRFSPNGQEAVMAASQNGNTDIYLINLATMQKRQLTEGAFIDTSPYFSPDGNKITFSSDRSGRSHIYVMNKDGSNPQRISFGSGSYFTPSWSPRGDFIAFTKITSGGFHIGVMRPDGSGERILTEGYSVEGPTWSPNGRVIMFTSSEKTTRKRLGRTMIQTIDLTGYHQHSVATKTEASDPSWSPLLE